MDTSLVECPRCAVSVLKYRMDAGLHVCVPPSSSSSSSSSSPAAPANKAKKRDRAEEEGAGQRGDGEKKAKKKKKKGAPLADAQRPSSLSEVVGQDLHFISTLLTADAHSGQPFPSLLLWGPPGSGKTTVCRIVAEHCRRLLGMRAVALSATTASVADVRKQALQASKTGTVLFIDELHRFNKGQQDVLLPAVESGKVCLLGATTENPSFSINSALLSRCRLILLNKLSEAAVTRVLQRVQHITAAPDAHERIAQLSNGDARQALNLLEAAAQMEGRDATVTAAAVDRVSQRAATDMDKGGDAHYDTISALHKSLRGSDAAAALYWLTRMLEGGQQPLYIARRLVRFAAEDIGIACPQALQIAVAAFQAAHFMGMPECDVVLAQCVAFLARAPKSNACYTALGAIQALVRRGPNPPVPLHLRNAPTALMAGIGYGKGYQYNPDYAPEDVTQTYVPPTVSLPDVGALGAVPSSADGSSGGVGEAMYGLGARLYDDEDYAAALPVLLEAGQRHHHATALGLAGWLLDSADERDADGVVLMAAAARTLATRPAHTLDKHALFVLARAREAGLGVDKTADATALYKAAAAVGSVDATNRLAALKTVKEG